MNDNHPQDEFLYRQRWLGPLVKQAIHDHPVIILTGARQTGKSTLLRNEKHFSDWRYISLDDYDALEQAERNPESLWAGAEKIVIDEVQKSPRLLSAIKQVVDSNRLKMRFVLSGDGAVLERLKVKDGGRTTV